MFSLFLMVCVYFAFVSARTGLQAASPATPQPVCIEWKDRSIIECSASESGWRAALPLILGVQCSLSTNSAIF